MLAWGKLLSSSGALAQRDLLVLSSLARRLSSCQISPMSTSTQQTSEKHGLLRLPTPVLDETLAKFLKSIKPVVTKQEYEKATQLAKDFSAAGGEGRKLQGLLEKKGQEEDNWLARWWLNTAYLEYRDPVVVFSSPGLVWPEKTFSCQGEQLVYAAWVIRAALEFNTVLDRREIPQEKMGATPLDMGQYYKILGTTRIPHPGRDRMSYQDLNSPSRTVVVMYNNHAFSLRVYKEDGVTPLDVRQIYGQLQHVVSNSAAVGPAVGVLTSDNRDAWADNYFLLSKEPGNIQSLLAIEEALFVVCLDQPLEASVMSKQTKTGQLLIHGCGGTKGNGGNRWYDKTLQFVIGAKSDGVGVTYEHSPAEGGPIGVLTDFVVDKVNKLPLTLTADESYPRPQKLEWIVTDYLQQAIQEAACKLDKLAQDLHVCGFSFSTFGKNSLKEAKVSPDSFIQVAIQFAYYKVHGAPAAQYESGSLRKFIHGRTDVIRTCSEEVAAFCASDVTVGPEARAKLLRAAIDSHKKYAVDVVNGKGVDRHLLGLKLLAREHKLQVPQLYSDAGYVNSTTFRLSTSNVPSKCDGFMVYGPLVQDGYACCYNPRNDNINFGTSAWVSNPCTDLNAFTAGLVEALVEMRQLLAVEQQPKSKL